MGADGPISTSSAVDGMDVDGEEEDAVVRELDVYLCNDFSQFSTQLCLLQHPLRPPWRPYDYGRVQAMRLKPRARRIEVDLPLATESRNYNDVIEDYKKIKSFTLRSTLTESQTTLAVGTVKGGKLLIAPLDYAVQLRPSLHHLNVAAATKKKDDDSDEEEDDEPKMHAVEVQVQKRETERQAQARKNSYAYISQQEEEEPFVRLTVHGEESAAAHGIWERLMVPTEADPGPRLDCDAYLRAIVPPQGSSTGGGQAPAGGAGPGAEPAMAMQPTSGRDQLSDSARAALPAALRALFKDHSVCSMANVRTWLDTNPAAAAAKEAAFLTDRALHEAVLGLGTVASMHRVYLVSKIGDEKTDPVRKLVLELLASKEHFKRSEFNDLARTHNLAFTETMYNKVVKDLCESKGNTWHIKNGAAGL